MSGPAHTLIGMSTALTILRPIVQVHPVLKSGGWAFGWEALAAIGTLILASVTVRLAKSTSRLAEQAQNEARAVKDNSGVVKEQVELQREQAEAAQRPLVVPAPSAGWTDGKNPYNSQSGPPPWTLVLPVKNVGPGAALNVTGYIDFGVLFSDTPDRRVRLCQRAWRHLKLKIYDLTGGENPIPTGPAPPASWITRTSQVERGDVLRCRRGNRPALHPGQTHGARHETRRNRSSKLSGSVSRAIENVG